MAFDNSTISQPDLHMNAAAGRKPFSADGGASGRIKLVSAWTAADATIDGNIKNVFKIQRNGYVSNFSLKADADMDTNVTPTLTWDVGITGVTATDADEFMAAVTGDEALAGHDTNVVDESLQLGTRVVAGDYITIGTSATGGAATAAAGNLSLAFDFSEE